MDLMPSSSEKATISSGLLNKESMSAALSKAGIVVMPAVIASALLSVNKVAPTALCSASKQTLSQPMELHTTQTDEQDCRGHFLLVCTLPGVQKDGAEPLADKGLSKCSMFVICSAAVSFCGCFALS